MYVCVCVCVQPLKFLKFSQTIKKQSSYSTPKALHFQPQFKMALYQLEMLMHSFLSVKRFPIAAFKSTPMLVWLSTVHSRLRKVSMNCFISPFLAAVTAVGPVLLKAANW